MTIVTDAEVIRYAPLVKSIAHRLKLRLPPSIEVDDLVQAGMIGLLDALQRYRQDSSAAFATYASQRIRGAIMDSLRANDEGSRRSRRHFRALERAITALQHRHGRQPSDAEIAAELSVPLKEYQQMQQEARGHPLIYYEDFHAGESEDVLDQHFPDLSQEPLRQLIEDATLEAIADGIRRLPPREREVITMHYEREMTLRQIGTALGFSESRACQLHGSGIRWLRKHLSQFG